MSCIKEDVGMGLQVSDNLSSLQPVPVVWAFPTLYPSTFLEIFSIPVHLCLMTTVHLVKTMNLHGNPENVHGSHVYVEDQFENTGLFKNGKLL